MKHYVYRGTWAGCSDLRKKREQLAAAHQEFEASDLKKRLDEEWRVVKHRRPRIKKEDIKIIMVFDRPVRITMQEYRDHYTLTFTK